MSHDGEEALSDLSVLFVYGIVAYVLLKATFPHLPYPSVFTICISVLLAVPFMLAEDEDDTEDKASIAKPKSVNANQVKHEPTNGRLRELNIAVEVREKMEAVFKFYVAAAVFAIVDRLGLRQCNQFTNGIPKSERLPPLPLLLARVVYFFASLSMILSCLQLCVVAYMKQHELKMRDQMLTDAHLLPEAAAHQREQSAIQGATTRAISNSTVARARGDFFETMDEQFAEISALQDPEERMARWIDMIRQAAAQ